MAKIGLSIEEKEKRVDALLTLYVDFKLAADARGVIISCSEAASLVLSFQVMALRDELHRIGSNVIQYED